MTRLQRLALIVILGTAAALRLTGVDWDGYNHYHPDERYITWVATTIDAPEHVEGAFVPWQSSFNPFYWAPGAESEGIVVVQDEPRRYAYGHFPLYLGVVATRLVEKVPASLVDRLPSSWLLTQDILNGAQRVEFRHLTAVTRVLTALVDLATVFLVFLLGRQLYSVNVGLAAAAFLAVNVMHIQLAHFFAVDPYLTLFTVATVYLLALASGRREHSLRFVLLAAVFVGFAVGSKFSAVMLFLPLALVLWRNEQISWRAMWGMLFASGATAAVVFFVTNPFAVLDWTCQVTTPATSLGPLEIPRLNWRSCYLDNISRQSAMVRGGSAFPFTRQYFDTAAYLYPVLMQLRWGMGLPLGLAAFGGFGWAVARGASRMERLRSVTRERAGEGELALLAWTIPYFLVTGGFFVKFMRYLLPLTPFLMIYAAAWVLSWRRVRLRRAALIMVLLSSLLYALAFVNLYNTPHPWVTASEWIYRNVPRGRLIVSERWDDSLPSSLEVDGRNRRRQQYESEEIDWLSALGAEDDAAKLERNLELLEQADYLTIVSNRNYGVIARLEDLYPLSSQYYELLFRGELGYELVYSGERSPRLAGVALWPQRFAHLGLAPPAGVTAMLDETARLTFGPADESFTVYDQPLPMIFYNSGGLTAEEMAAKFR